MDNENLKEVKFGSGYNLICYYNGSIQHTFFPTYKGAYEAMLKELSSFSSVPCFCTTDATECIKIIREEARDVGVDGCTSWYRSYDGDICNMSIFSVKTMLNVKSEEDLQSKTNGFVLMNHYNGDLQPTYYNTFKEAYESMKTELCSFSEDFDEDITDYQKCLEFMKNQDDVDEFELFEWYAWYRNGTKETVWDAWILPVSLLSE